MLVQLGFHVKKYGPMNLTDKTRSHYDDEFAKRFLWSTNICTVTLWNKDYETYLSLRIRLFQTIRYYDLSPKRI